MLLVQATRFGGPEVLAARQAPDPVAGPGQVVVRTSASVSPRHHPPPMCHPAPLSTAHPPCVPHFAIY